MKQHKQYKYSELPKCIQKEIDRRRECRDEYGKLFLFDPCGEMLYYDWKAKKVKFLESEEKIKKNFDKQYVEDCLFIMNWFIKRKWNKEDEVIVFMNE